MAGNEWDSIIPEDRRKRVEEEERERVSGFSRSFIFYLVFGAKRMRDRIIFDGGVGTRLCSETYPKWSLDLFHLTCFE